MVGGGEEEAGELAGNLGESVFDEAVEPAAFLRLTQGDEVFLGVDEFTFLSREGLFVLDPVC